MIGELYVKGLRLDIVRDTTCWKSSSFSAHGILWLSIATASKLSCRLSVHKEGRIQVEVIQKEEHILMAFWLQIMHPLIVQLFLLQEIAYWQQWWHTDTFDRCYSNMLRKLEQNGGKFVSELDSDDMRKTTNLSTGITLLQKLRKPKSVLLLREQRLRVNATTRTTAMASKIDLWHCAGVCVQRACVAISGNAAKLMQLLTLTDTQRQGLLSESMHLPARGQDS